MARKSHYQENVLNKLIPMLNLHNINYSLGKFKTIIINDIIYKTAIFNDNVNYYNFKDENIIKINDYIKSLNCKFHIYKIVISLDYVVVCIALESIKFSINIAFIEYKKYIDFYVGYDSLNNDLNLFAKSRLHIKYKYSGKYCLDTHNYCTVGINYKRICGKCQFSCPFEHKSYNICFYDSSKSKFTYFDSVSELYTFLCQNYPDCVIKHSMTKSAKF